MVKLDAKKKLRELIVYISKKCASDESYATTKLNKILFYADSYYFLTKGKTITGMEAVHLDHGPVIQNSHRLLEEMEGKDIAFAFVQSGPYTQKKPVALREPNLSVFEPEMIALLDEIIDAWCNHRKVRAKWLSEATHKLMGWRVTSKNEIIPPHTFFLKSKDEQKFNSWEVKRAQEIAAQLGDLYEFGPV